MAKYVQFGPVTSAAPPIVCTGADLFVFALPAAIANLTYLCHRVFQESSHGKVKCKPLGPWVFVVAGSIRHVSGNSQQRPGVHEKNILVHVPVAVEADGETFPAVFSPYVWVDNPNSMTGGREVFGYCKSLGQIDIENPADPDSFQLNVFGGNDSSETWKWHQDFLSIRRSRMTSRILVNIIDLVEEAEEVADLVSSWADPDSEVKEIFYKQFRASSDCIPGQTSSACFSEILTAKYVVYDRVSLEPLNHEYEFTIAPLDSHPLRAELGLPARCEVPGYRMKTNFRVEYARSLWTGH